MRLLKIQLLLGVTLVFSGCIATKTFDKKSATGSISGKVVDTSTGEHLQGVSILLLETNIGTTTLKDGSYSMYYIPSGTYFITCWKPGYEGKLMRNINVPSNKTLHLKDIALKALEDGKQNADSTGTITGKVFDKNNHRPLSGVNVFLRYTDSWTVTETNGNYTLQNLPAGIYSLDFSFLGYKTLVLNNITVSSEKETSIMMELEAGSSIKMDTVPVLPCKD
jgi:hypothetical protein